MFSLLDFILKNEIILESLAQRDLETLNTFNKTFFDSMVILEKKYELNALARMGFQVLSPNGGLNVILSTLHTELRATAQRVFQGIKDNIQDNEHLKIIQKFITDHNLFKFVFTVYNQMGSTNENNIDCTLLNKIGSSFQSSAPAVYQAFEKLNDQFKMQLISLIKKGELKDLLSIITVTVEDKQSKEIAKPYILSHPTFCDKFNHDSTNKNFSIKLSIDQNSNYAQLSKGSSELVKSVDDLLNTIIFNSNMFYEISNLPTMAIMNLLKKIAIKFSLNNEIVGEFKEHIEEMDKLNKEIQDAKNQNEKEEKVQKFKKYIDSKKMLKDLFSEIKKLPFTTREKHIFDPNNTKRVIDQDSIFGEESYSFDGNFGLGTHRTEESKSFFDSLIGVVLQKIGVDQTNITTIFKQADHRNKIKDIVDDVFYLLQVTARTTDIAISLFTESFHVLEQLTEKSSSIADIARKDETENLNQYANTLGLPLRNIEKKLRLGFESNNVLSFEVSATSFDRDKLTKYLYKIRENIDQYKQKLNERLKIIANAFQECSAAIDLKEFCTKQRESRSFQFFQETILDTLHTKISNNEAQIIGNCEVRIRDVSDANPFSELMGYDDKLISYLEFLYKMIFKEDYNLESVSNPKWHDFVTACKNAFRQQNSSLFSYKGYYITGEGLTNSLIEALKKKYLVSHIEDERNLISESNLNDLHRMLDKNTDLLQDIIQDWNTPKHSIKSKLIFTQLDKFFKNNQKNILNKLKGKKLSEEQLNFIIKKLKLLGSLSSKNNILADKITNFNLGILNQDYEAHIDEMSKLFYRVWSSFYDFIDTRKKENNKPDFDLLRHTINEIPRISPPQYRQLTNQVETLRNVYIEKWEEFMKIFSDCDDGIDILNKYKDHFVGNLVRLEIYVQRIHILYPFTKSPEFTNSLVVFKFLKDRDIYDIFLAVIAKLISFQKGGLGDKRVLTHDEIKETFKLIEGLQNKLKKNPDSSNTEFVSRSDHWGLMFDRFKNYMLQLLPKKLGNLRLENAADAKVYLGKLQGVYDECLAVAHRSEAKIFKNVIVELDTTNKKMDALLEQSGILLAYSHNRKKFLLHKSKYNSILLDFNKIEPVSDKVQLASENFTELDLYFSENTLLKGNMSIVLSSKEKEDLEGINQKLKQLVAFLDNDIFLACITLSPDKLKVALSEENKPNFIKVICPNIALQHSVKNWEISDFLLLANITGNSTLCVLADDEDGKIVLDIKGAHNQDGVIPFKISIENGEIKLRYGYLEIDVNAL